MVYSPRSTRCFFLHPLRSESLFLFAFDDPPNQAVQVTCTVPAQRLRDSPHFFGQALARDLAAFQDPKFSVTEYVDDILLCAQTDKDSQTGSSALLNVLVDREYRVSRKKAQILQEAIKHLGLIINKGTRGQSTALSLISGPQNLQTTQRVLEGGHRIL
jgi:hypothetical protein